MEADKVVRLVSLVCATLHYSLSNLGHPESKPARTDTIIRAADKFEVYVNTGESGEESPPLQ